MSATARLENYRLTVFRKVAEQASFRKAAEELYLTQPAVSQQIKALEEELNVVLFDRSGLQVKLTDAGRTLLEYAERSSQLLQQAAQAVAALSGEHSGELLLGASTTIAQYVLPQLLSSFCASHPRLHPRLISGNTEQMVAALEQEKIALALIEGPPRSRDVVLTPFLDDELVLLVPATEEWESQTEILPTDLEAAPLLMRERGSGTRRIVELAFEQHHIRRSALNIAMELDSTEAIKSAVEAGLGVGFVSRRALSKDARLGNAFHIVKVRGIRFPRQFFLVSVKGPELAGAAAEFRSFVLTSTRAARIAAPVARKEKAVRR